jgi:hypothetical protein
LKNALTQMQIPAELLNMDETEFCSRPEEARKTMITWRYDCLVKPAFTEQDHPNHVGLVATIAFSGEVLKPMC